MDSKPPLPPFTDETAVQKIRLAEDAWNTRDPARVANLGGFGQVPAVEEVFAALGRVTA